MPSFSEYGTYVLNSGTRGSSVCILWTFLWLLTREGVKQQPSLLFRAEIAESYSSSPLCWGHLLPQQAHLYAFCWARSTQRGSGLYFMPAPGRAKCGSVSKCEIKEPPPPFSAELLQRTEATLSTSLPPWGFCWPSPNTYPFLWPLRARERPWPLP